MSDLKEKIMNDRVLYNAQKEMLEEVKQELLKKAETERQRNIIKEVCNSIARKHKFDDMKNTQKSGFKGVRYGKRS